MSKVLYALLACGLLLPTMAHADDPYLKLGLGWSHYRYGGLIASDETGFSIAYGAKYDKMWGLEAGYVDFGRDKAFDFKAETIYLAGTGSLPLNPQVALYGKLGVAFKRYKIPGDSERFTSAMGAVGATWMLKKEWGASLEYAYYGKSSDVSLGQTTLAAVYHF